MKLPLMFAGALILAGCTLFPAARESFYYAIEYEAPDQVPDSAGLGSVRVFEPTVGPAYDRRQIVLRGDSARYQYLSDDMWGVKLGATMQLLIERYYEDVPTFEVVRGEFDRAGAEYEIHTAVRRVEYVEGDPPRTRVEIVFELREADDDGATLVRHTSDYDEPTESEGGLEQFVSEVNRIMLDSIAAFDAEIRETLGASQADS